MADKKISQLTVATIPLAGTEVLPIVQGGSTVKVSAADITAGRSISASGLTLSGGTANGVLYLNSPGKAATSGTALYFNGTQFGVGTNSINPANTAEVTGDISSTWAVAVTRFIGARFANGANYELGINVYPDARETRVFAKAADTGGVVTFATGVTPAVRMSIDGSGNVIAGASAALATTATVGFLYVPTCAGAPTGTPTAVTGMVPIVVDTTNNKLYFYSTGVWRDAGP